MRIKERKKQAMDSKQAMESMPESSWAMTYLSRAVFWYVSARWPQPDSRTHSWLQQTVATFPTSLEHNSKSAGNKKHYLSQ